MTESPSAKRSVPAAAVNASDSNVTGAWMATPAMRTSGTSAWRERALLDDPCERALAEVVGGEIEERSAIAFDAHRLDGGHAIGRQHLPGPDGAQKRGAARTDRVDACVPVVGVRRRFRRDHARTIGERHGQPRARERARECEAREPCAGDQHVAVGAVGDHGSRSSVSMTWFWLV